MVIKLCRFSKLLLSWLLVVVILAMLLEATFVYYAPWVFPVAALEKSGAGSTILLQTSKADSYPRHYIAIMGDSYAYGQGDWLLENEHARHPQYSAAHLLYSSTGRDVISLGRPASDSIRSNIAWPQFFISAAERTRGQPIEDPELILVYFYEGNDLNDNVEVIEKLVRPYFHEDQKIKDQEFFQETIIPHLLSRNEYIQHLSSVSRLDGFFLFNMALGVLTDAYHRYVGGKVRNPWSPPKKGDTTQVNVGGVVDFMPNRIQSPALTLDQDQIDTGVYVFEQSLVYLQKRFPESRIGIVYIPSVITPYRVVSSEIHDYYPDQKSGSRIQNSGKIRQNSDHICQSIRRVAERHRLGFVDARARLRALAKSDYVHGPIDWNHFNKKGYTALAEDLEILVNQLSGLSESTIGLCRYE